MTVRIARIQEEVSDFYGISLADMLAAGRRIEFAYPRQVAMFLAREMTPKTNADIGRRFNRDHATVAHAIKVIAKRSVQQWSTRTALDAIRGRLGT